MAALVSKRQSLQATRIPRLPRDVSLSPSIPAGGSVRSFPSEWSQKTEDNRDWFCFNKTPSTKMESILYRCCQRFRKKSAQIKGFIQFEPQNSETKLQTA